MRTTLQQWLNENREGSKAAVDQALFIRDRLASTLYRDYDEYSDHYPVQVISQHYSSGSTLPVYEFLLANGDRLTLRGNFHNWVVTVESSCPVEADFMDLLDPRASWYPAICEGFPADRVLAPLAENRRNFTVGVGSDHELYTFCFILGNALGLRKKARR